MKQLWGEMTTLFILLNSPHSITTTLSPRTFFFFQKLEEANFEWWSIESFKMAPIVAREEKPYSQWQMLKQQLSYIHITNLFSC